MTLPLTPPTCDLRGLGFMPMDVQRLLDSDTVALTTGDEFKAALLLWMRAWSQVPAASVPSDPRLLARMAGVALSEWPALAPMVLRGWIECDDGRFYHPVVAEKALRAWIERLGYQDRSAKAQAARHETFVYQPDEFASLRRQAAICLERLVAGSALAMGVVLQGDDLTPSGSDPAPSGSPSRTAFPSEERGKGERRDREGRGEEGSLVVSAPPKPTCDIHRALSLYNETAEELGLPTARKLSEARREKLVATLREHGPDGWDEAMQRLRRSPHCRGQNDRGWKADLDFLLTPSRFLRLVEGAYEGTAFGTSRGVAASYLDVALGAAA